MRAGAGLDADHAARLDQAAALQPLGVLAGDEIVGHHRDVDVAGAKPRQQRLDQRGLAGPDRSADADARRPEATISHGAHRSM